MILQWGGGHGGGGQALFILRIKIHNFLTKDCFLDAIIFLNDIIFLVLVNLFGINRCLSSFKNGQFKMK